MTVREKIVNLIEDENYKPMDKNTLASIFSLNKRQRREIFNILDDLEREGRIFKSRNELYLPMGDSNLIVGRFQGNEKGFGFLIPDDEDIEDIFIPKVFTNSAMDKDRIIVKITTKAESDRRSEGEVVKILERTNKEIVGSFIDNKNFGFVIADNQNLGYDIFIPKGKSLRAKNKQKVVVNITKYPELGQNPEGEITEVLGYMSEKGTDILSVIRNYKLPEKFPEEVLNSLDNINQEVTDQDIENRLDLREETIFTIDGIDAKDLDDGVSIEKKPNGNYILGVHIADVAHYVDYKSPIDKEAFERGNSVYLLDKVIPMLPEELSNGICSLNPNEDRLTLSVLMEIDHNGGIIDYDIKETVIRSKARLIYEDISDLLEGKEVKVELNEFKEELFLMNELAEILAKKRNSRGSLDFNFKESKIILDKNGRPIDITQEDRRIANRIIEEFMIITNEVISENYYWSQIPFLYRIHEEPEPTKMKEFKEIIHNLGYNLKGKNEIHSRELQNLLEEVKGHDEESLISMLLLRSLKKARYSEIRDSHFGLASEYYSHFTAPIRRYSDLTIHRIIKDSINNKLNQKKKDKWEKELPDIANHVSETEKLAEDIEREVMDMKKAEYMTQYIGWEFTGKISSLTNFGIFVELHNTIEGLIRFQDMSDDYYSFDEVNYRVIGSTNNKIYKLGDRVNILVKDASPERRTINFLLMEEE